MRINEIIDMSGDAAHIHENDNGFKEIVSSILFPLKAENVAKITLDQLKSLIQRNGIVDNIELDDSAIMDIVGQNPVVQKIEIDPDNDNAMTVFLDIPDAGRFVDVDTEEKEKEKISKTATKVAKDNLK